MSPEDLEEQIKTDMESGGVYISIHVLKSWYSVFLVNTYFKLLLVYPLIIFYVIFHILKATLSQSLFITYSHVALKAAMPMHSLLACLI